MNSSLLKKALPHIIAIAVFLVVTLIYCSPALQGKVLQQSDMVHAAAMQSNSLKYQAKHGTLPLWTNGMFCGMPAFQILVAGDAGHFSLNVFHNLFTFFLPHPFDFFFLMCVSFYFLSQVLRIDYRIGILAGLVYAYASYTPIIVEVGHVTKALAMGYLPAAFGAYLLVFQKKYWVGTALSMLFTVLLIAMNHPQIDYYFLIILGCFFVSRITWLIKQKDFRHLLITFSILAVSAVVGVCSNLVILATTYDFSKASTRGGTALSSNSNTRKDDSKSGGLDVDYAYQWSYGIDETYTLLVPDIYGGKSSGEDFANADSHIAKTAMDKGIGEDQAIQFAGGFPAYWGNQTFTSGPVYLGAGICLLFILGLVFIKSSDKWWILAASAIGIMLSWGKNFPQVNNFLFYHLPLYNKFRAPTMSLVIPQLLFPFLSMITLQQFFFSGVNKDEIFRKLKIAGYVILGIFAVAALLYINYNYKGPNDGRLLNNLEQATKGNKEVANEFYKALKQDRQSLFGSDLIRSVFFAGAVFLCLLLSVKNKLNASVAILCILVLCSIDLLMVDRRYLNANNFEEQESVNESAFAPTAADAQIMKDTSYYRVINLTTDPFSDAMPSYFHNNVGGYSPAKLSIIEDLITYQLRKQPMNQRVLDMLNTKYFIVPGQNGQPMAEQNPNALGPCWFVRSISWANTALDAMNALNTLNPKDTAVVEIAYKKMVPFVPEFDSSAKIILQKNDNDEIYYHSTSKTNQFAVFSEIFYERQGWKAYIDGKEAPIVKTDYALRGLAISSGPHEIKFEFRPDSYYKSFTIVFIASLLGWLIILVALWKAWNTRKIV
ncbi:MAG TPA: YfhO family protein [Puia sp.]|nr:YfhO family protein [Puia sp.]